MIPVVQCPYLCIHKIRFLIFQVNNLNQEVSNLAKELQTIMHFLQSHMSSFHCSAPVPTYSCGVQMMPSPNVTVSSDWQPPAPLSIATGLHLHHDTISHPPRNVWGCSRIPSQGRSPTLINSSRHMSPCLCCSDRDGSRVNNIQSQCGPFSSARTTPNSPYVSHRQRGPTLLGISSAFNSFPIQQMGYNNMTVPTMSSSHPLCSPVHHSHSPLSIITDPTHTQGSQTAIHSSLTPMGQPHLHTAFSPLTTSGLHSAAWIRSNQGQQGTASGPRQNNPVGSSPIRMTQGSGGSLLGLVTDRDCRDGQEKTDHSEASTVEAQ